MAKSIRISDRLYEEASVVSSLLDRSIAQQIEHWVKLGRSIEAIQGADSDVVRVKIESNMAKDAALVKRGELSPFALSAFSGGIMNEIVVHDIGFNEIDFEELGNDYR